MVHDKYFTRNYINLYLQSSWLWQDYHWSDSKCLFNNMCCGACCKEFKGWCQSFTRTEKALTIIEAILLVVLVVFLIFLILHLLACSTPEYEHEPPEKENYDSEDLEDIELEKPVKPTKVTNITHKTIMTKVTIAAVTNKIPTTKHKTIDPNMECSWTPSAKTTALTRYFELDAAQTNRIEAYEAAPMTTTTKPKHVTTTKHRTKKYTKSGYSVDFIDEDQSDGEEADSVQNEYILSLVKPKPPKGVVFGCILTVIHKFFMLTSASCIEAIEEVDSLDSFVIMEDYGSSSPSSQMRALSDVQIHPFYRGVNRSYDVALVRSAEPLPRRALALPAPLDAALATIGERLHILGFGPYRSADASAGRGLRAAPVYRLPTQQCAGAALRHLEAGVAVGAGAPGGGGGGPLCAGALYARGLACQYCGGSPLLRGARLLALMADNPQCGVACEPQLYVNLAACRGWIDSVVNAQ